MNCIWTTRSNGPGQETSREGSDRNHQGLITECGYNLSRQLNVQELEAVGGSKHRTESSKERQLPVGDVYSSKLPCVFVEKTRTQVLSYYQAVWASSLLQVQLCEVRKQFVCVWKMATEEV